ncbi:MAG: N-acetyltransferase [Candidatus Acidiferrales bacterium]
MTARRFPSLGGFLLRLACEADFETLYAIDQVCYSAAIAYTRAELRWYMGLRGSECLVAEARTRARSSSARSRIAGFIVTASRTIHGHIVTIDVLEMYRRTGAGSALLRRAEEQMERRGVAEVWLETATNNEAAIAFWKKHGYRTHGRLPNYYPDGLDALAMSKPLAATLSNKNGGEEK